MNRSLYHFLAFPAVIAGAIGWLWFGTAVNGATLGAFVVITAISVDVLIKRRRGKRRVREYQQQLRQGRLRDYLWEKRYGKRYF